MTTGSSASGQGDIEEAAVKLYGVWCGSTDSAVTLQQLICRTCYNCNAIDVAAAAEDRLPAECHQTCCCEAAYHRLEE